MTLQFEGISGDVWKAPASPRDGLSKLSEEPPVSPIQTKDANGPENY
jgi:hypothetical protein